MSKVDLARDMANEFPDASNRALGKLLRQKYPNEFPSQEAGRTTIRTAKGVHGKWMRQTSKQDAYTPWARSMASVEACIPEETQKELIPYHIENGYRYLVVADIHIPEHSKLAVETAIEFGLKQGCTAVLEDGDITEHAATSRHAKDPTLPRLSAELQARTSYTKFMREKFKGPYYSKLGNHESNVMRYCQQHAPELVGLPCIEFDELMGFKRFGIEVVDDKQVIQAGKLSIIHGHEYRNGGDLVNPARWLSLRAKDCCACAHFHRSMTYTDRRITGFEAVYYSIGCLRQRTPDFNPLNNWTWGFAILDLAKDGDFIFNNYRILSRGNVVPA